MSDSLSWSVEIDRDSQNYNLHIDYFINGYTDPEDGEYFGDTTWSFTFARVPPGGAGSGGDGGFSSEAATITEGLLADFSPGLFHYRLDFKAWNTFSGDLHPLEASWDVFNAAFAVGPRTIIGTSTNDIVLGGSGDDLIRTFGGNDTIDGGGGDDIIDAGAGNDTIAGGTGNDIMIGGAGDDTYTVDAPGDLVVERAGEGFDTIIASFSFTLPDNVEQLLLFGLDKIDGTGNAGDNQISGNSVANKLYGLDGNDILTGNGGDDMLFGGGGNDTLDGGTGNDRMDGGAGNDTFRVDSQLDRVIEAPGGGNDTIITTFLRTYTLPAEVEKLQAILLPGVGFHGIGNGGNNVIEGTASNDVLEGGAGNDDLVGNDGNDTLIGGPGADALRGGNGIDTASYATSAAAVTVNLGSGKGTGGNDVIVGGAGADALDGGLGNDMVSYMGSTGGVIVNLALQTVLGGDATGDTIAGFENAQGGNGDDSLTGSATANALWGGAGNDIIVGGEGNDTINGGPGADKMEGGDGVDTLSYAGSTVGVSVNLVDETVAGGDAAGDTISGFENVVGSDSSDFILGNDGNNVLSGGGGPDFLDGRGGNDLLIGGDLADTFVFGTGYGHDTIKDFTPGLSPDESIMLLLGPAFDTFSAIMAVAQASGPSLQNTVFRFDANTSLTLDGVKPAQLTANDFQFV